MLARLCDRETMSQMDYMIYHDYFRSVFDLVNILTYQLSAAR